MIVLYIIIGIVVLAFVGNFLGGGKQAKEHGPARVLVYPIIDRLEKEFPKHKKLVDNDGRLKYHFFSDSFDFTTDFIYSPRGVQVTMEFESMLGNKARRVKNCGYDTDEIERAVTDIYKSFFQTN